MLAGQTGLTLQYPSSKLENRAELKWHVTYVTDTIAERKVPIPKISKASVCVKKWTYSDFKVDRGIVNYRAGVSGNRQEKK